MKQTAAEEAPDLSQEDGKTESQQTSNTSMQLGDVGNAQPKHRKHTLHIQKYMDMYIWDILINQALEIDPLGHKTASARNSLAVQFLGLHALTAKGWGSISNWGTLKDPKVMAWSRGKKKRKPSFRLHYMISGCHSNLVAGGWVIQGNNHQSTCENHL